MLAAEARKQAERLADGVRRWISRALQRRIGTDMTAG